MDKQEAKEKLHNLAFAKLNTKPDDLKLTDVMKIVDKIYEPKQDVVFIYDEWLRVNVKEHTFYQSVNFTESMPMPKHGDAVLVSDGHSVWVDYWFIFDHGVFLKNTKLWDFKSLWWMPLPEPPKIEEVE